MLRVFCSVGIWGDGRVGAWSLRCRFGGPELRNRGLKEIGLGRFRYTCFGHFTAMTAVDDGSVDIVSRVWAGLSVLTAKAQGFPRWFKVIGAAAYS